MKVLCLLLVSGLALAYAIPPGYRAGPVALYDEDDDASDEAEVEDEPVDDSDVYTFPTGGPGGPPSNMYMEEPSRQAREEVGKAKPSSIYYESENDIPEGVVFTYDNDQGPVAAPASRARLDGPAPESDESENEVVQDEEEEEEEEDEEEDDDAEQSDDNEEGFSVPDLNKLFPNPDNRPRGPNDYQQYLAHLPKNQGQGQQGQGRPAGPGRGAPPPSRHYSQGYQGRVPPPPARRYRTETNYPVGNYLVGSGPVASDEDSVIVSAPPSYSRRQPWYRMEEDDDASAEDDAEDEEEDEEAADDVDFSVPAYETLFPNPDQKATPAFYGNMKNSWNNAPKPPGQGRILRLFQSPMHHDNYNPEYVINPTIANNRRNERLRKRYSDPHWRMQNIQHPWNYKPLLYQRGHYGNPREHDVHPQTGDYYLGGIYNGKNYY